MGTSRSVEIKAPDSALQPPDIKAGSFTPLRSFFVIKTASVNQNTKEERRVRISPFTLQISGCASSLRSPLPPFRKMRAGDLTF
jgi:hypothetical protein